MRRVQRLHYLVTTIGIGKMPHVYVGLKKKIIEGKPISIISFYEGFQIPEAGDGVSKMKRRLRRPTEMKARYETVRITPIYLSAGG